MTKIEQIFRDESGFLNCILHCNSISYAKSIVARYLISLRMHDPMSEMIPQGNRLIIRTRSESLMNLAMRSIL